MIRSLTTAAAVSALFCSVARSEVPLMSPEELRSDASLVVIGKVRAVYRSEKITGNWERITSVAELAVASVEKGESVRPGGVVYAQFWNQRPIEEGPPEPHSSGHHAVDVGDHVRAYLVTKQGAYHALLPNGFVKLSQPEYRDAVREAEVEAGADLEAVEGKWVRKIKTDQGTFTITKEHRGRKTTLTVTDSQGNLVDGKTSEFRLERRDQVRVFTFFNNVYTHGPYRGRSVDTESSYIYRVIGDSFVEIRGALVGDPDAPDAFVWERVKQ